MFLLSVVLFGYAAYLLWDPKPGPTIEERLADARSLIKAERPEAAVELLNKLNTVDKLTSEQQSRIHLMFAESLEQYQDQKRQTIPALQYRIIEQSKLAIARGAQMDGLGYRRVGRAYELIGKTNEALENYTRAASLDPDRALRLSRKIIDMLLDRDDATRADSALIDYLKDTKITDAERAWALGQRAQILTDQKQYSDARALLDQALKLTADQMQEGEINYRLGYVAYKLGDLNEADRYLRVSRDQLKIRHPLDADVCVLLGDIYRAKDQPDVANSFYQIVLVSHPDSKASPIARLGRGLARTMLKEDDAAIVDLTDLAKEVDQRSSRQRYRVETIAALQKAGNLMSLRGNAQGAIELMGYEQLLNPIPAPEFFARLAGLYERRADQVESSLAGATPADRIKQETLIRELRTKAGDAYIAHSQKIVVMDDKQQGESLWRGTDLYDRAGNTQASISALDLFVAERPQDPLAPDALLRLGRAYQSMGALDKAITIFQKNQFSYSKSLAASKSAVPLAQSLIAKGPESFARAESVLIGVLDNNPLLDPSSEDFRNALFELGQLQYRTGRFEEAVVRLEEFHKRYPSDARLGELLFLMADSYRKSAQQLQEKMTAANTAKDTTIDPLEMETARRDRLKKAKDLYDRVVDLYQSAPPTRDLDKLYYKLSHFYRADCLYDVGSYEAAITLYDNAAFRFQDDPSSLAAYVQIVNAWCRLGKPEAAKTANERAKWLLKRIPPEAFADGSFSMPKEYWEQWLKFSNDAGMW
ncbi:MAG: tetratricopeptide repeat protein [Burkholderiales bacterium]|nr:tetratricopeptide repeat protein [Phycisphaerae bacterium]